MFYEIKNNIIDFGKYGGLYEASESQLKEINDYKSQELTFCICDQGKTLVKLWKKKILPLSYDNHHTIMTYMIDKICSNKKQSLTIPFSYYVKNMSRELIGHHYYRFYELILHRYKYFINLWGYIVNKLTPSMLNYLLHSVCRIKNEEYMYKFIRGVKHINQDADQFCSSIFYNSCKISMRVFLHIIKISKPSLIFNDYWGRCYINVACSGNLEVLKYIEKLEKFDHNECLNYGGWSAYHCSADAGHLHILQYFNEQNTPIFKGLTNNDYTPYKLACANGHLNIVEYLEPIGEGLDNFDQRNSLESPYCVVAKEGKINILEYFDADPIRQKQNVSNLINLDLPDTTAVYLITNRPEIKFSSLIRLKYILDQQNNIYSCDCLPSMCMVCFGEDVNDYFVCPFDHISHFECQEMLEENNINQCVICTTRMDDDTFKTWRAEKICEKNIELI